MSDHDTSTPDVVTLGEAMALLVAASTGPLEQVRQFEKRTAGAETNVAVGLARLGLHVAWVSKLGDDSLGRFLLHEFQREGVDCSRVRTVPGARTGFMFKGRVDDGSDPPIEYHRRGSAASTLGTDDLDLAWLAGARHGHVTGIFPALTPATFAATQAAMALWRAKGRSISFDPNLRPALWPDAQQMRDTLNRLAAQADWVLPGLEEGRLLTGEATPQGIARFYRERGARLVVVKLGAEGAWYEDEAGTGAPGGGHGGRRRRLCRGPDQCPAAGARHAGRGAAGSLDRRARRAGARRYRRPADAGGAGGGRAVAHDGQPTSLRRGCAGAAAQPAQDRYTGRHARADRDPSR
jgi:sugar/nucleoside kinase (ribokinase family)